MVGASIVAFLPRFVFLTSFVTNDNLVDLLGDPTHLCCAAVRAETGSLGYGRGGCRHWVVTDHEGIGATSRNSSHSACLHGDRLEEAYRDPRDRCALGPRGHQLVPGADSVRYGDPLARAASSRYLAQVGGLGTFLTPYKVGDPLRLIFVQVPDRILNSFWYQSGWNQFHWKWPISLFFSVVLLAALRGLVHRHVDRRALVTLWTVAIAGFLSVWVVATETSTYQARYTFCCSCANSCISRPGFGAMEIASPVPASGDGAMRN